MNDDLEFQEMQKKILKNTRAQNAPKYVENWTYFTTDQNGGLIEKKKRVNFNQLPEERMPMTFEITNQVMNLMNLSKMKTKKDNTRVK